MFCSKVQLVKHGQGYEDVRPLPCRSWTCSTCAPARRRILIARAAAGEPTKFLTLTIRPTEGESPLERRVRLHDAWKKLVKRILRQFALPPDRRWLLHTPEGEPYQDIAAHTITADLVARAVEKLPYAAFVEKTKRGEPHLHILLRCPYIPQAWLAQQMGDLTGSPICDMRAIKNTTHAIRYVTKYVGKAPAQFGTTKRYWISRGWELHQPEAFDKEDIDWSITYVVKRRWSDNINCWPLFFASVEALDNGWTRFHRSHKVWSHDTG